MASPGRGKILYPTKHRICLTGSAETGWGWLLRAPAPDQTVLLVGTRTNYSIPKDAIRQAEIDFTRLRVDLMLMAKGKPAGTEGPRVHVSPFPGR